MPSERRIPVLSNVIKGSADTGIEYKYVLPKYYEIKVNCLK